MDRKIGLNGTQLKLLGVFLMTVNHLELLLYPYVSKINWLHFVVLLAGPMVAPTFVYLASEGYFYTRNKKRYLINLLMGFWLTSLCKFLLITFLNLNMEYENMLFMNIFGSLFQAVLSMYLYDAIIKNAKNKAYFKATLLGISLLAVLLSMFLMGTISDPLSLRLGIELLPIIVEGAPILPLMGLLFYVFRSKPRIILLIALVYTVPNSVQDLIGNGLLGSMWPALGFPLLVWLYNGKRGEGPNKYFFYIYYPAHITVFILLNYFFIQ